MKNNEVMETIFEAYFLWKKLNNLIKKYYSREVNIHEFITENICCKVNGYKIHNFKGTSSEDAVDENGKKIQIKATSNFNDDLSSFGPESKFDILEFVRLNENEDKFYLYRIDVEELKNIKVNKNETFFEKQITGQRPRFSIIKEIINKKNLEAYAVVDMKTGIVYF